MKKLIMKNASKYFFHRIIASSNWLVLKLAEKAINILVHLNLTTC